MARGLCQKHYERWARYGTIELPKREEKRCKIDGCDGRYKSNGYCSKHFEKFRRYGNPLQETHYESTDGICKVNGCPAPKFARGMCQPHYDLARKYGIDYSKNPSCYVCGKIYDTWDIRKINFDHVLPRSRGGKNNKENIKPICRKCNHSKNNMTIPELIEWCRLVISREQEILNQVQFI